MNDLTYRVKENLMIDHNADDDVIEACASAALTYAEGYQHLPAGYYDTHEMPPSTKQGVIMMASHFYESRDGSTGGFFNDNVNAADKSWQSCERLLRLDRNWTV